ncbi:MAG: asparagine--tRNA ligase [Candidatus Lokiarchaeota archaeon]|nr:asparagine--tRNA ligase [Candidatus Lokiarchaeota archaeon]
MEFKQINEVFSDNLIDKQVKVRGWIYRIRVSKKLVFITLRDATGIVQITCEKEKIGEEPFNNVKKLTIESSIEIKGIVREDKRSPGGYELNLDTINIIQEADVFPITKDQSIQFLLDKRHLWLRSQKLMKIFKIRAGLFNAFRNWFNKNNYMEVHCPILTSSAVEGGSTLFGLKYFDQQAYLTQSSQFYLESLIFSLEKVWTIAPSFRAEKSRTTRHLTEFWMLEAEVAHADLNDIMKIQEDLVSYVCKEIAQNFRSELEFLKIDPSEIEKYKAPFPRITYDKAIELLLEDNVNIEWGVDLGTEEEKILTDKFDIPVFVTDYPKKAKAFYHHIDPSRPDVVNCADLLAPSGYGEIIGGGQRIDSKEILLSRIQEENLDSSDYEWYIDLRKYGSVKHSGFGLGVERVIRWLLKLENIRDTLPYPRTINRIYP